MVYDYTPPATRLTFARVGSSLPFQVLVQTGGFLVQLVLLNLQVTDLLVMPVPLQFKSCDLTVCLEEVLRIEGKSLNGLEPLLRVPFNCKEKSKVNLEYFIRHTFYYNCNIIVNDLKHFKNTYQLFKETVNVQYETVFIHF